MLPVLFVCATSVFQLRSSRNAGGVETLLFTSQSKNQVTQQWMSGSPPVASTAPRLEVSVQPRCVRFPVAHWHWNQLGSIVLETGAMKVVVPYFNLN